MNRQYSTTLRGTMGISLLLILSTCRPSAEQVTNNIREDSLKRANATVRRIIDSIKTPSDSMWRAADSFLAAKGVQLQDAVIDPVDQQRQWDQWALFRDNEEKYEGTGITAWKVEVAMMLGDVRASLSGDFSRGCTLWNKDGTLPANQSPEFPKLHLHDWLSIDGKFASVASDGTLNIYCNRIRRSQRP